MLSVGEGLAPPEIYLRLRRLFTPVFAPRSAAKTETATIEILKRAVTAIPIP